MEDIEIQLSEVFRRCDQVDQSKHLWPLDVRERMLVNLARAIERCESEILQALDRDLGKPAFEGFTNEVGFVLSEIKHTLRELRVWAAPVCASTPLKLQPGRSMVWREPRGPTLVLSPWNYPFQLAVAPLVAAISAGNPTVLKPSEFSPATNALLRSLVDEIWPDGEVQVVEGDGGVAARLVEFDWSAVFFTGSEAVGRKVYASCSSRLIPVTLELGGKSPCIVNSDVDLEVVAARIVWGKFLNSGQTCIAPDYLLVHEALRGEILGVLQKKVREFYSTATAGPLGSPAALARIVSRRHFSRLTEMIDREREARPEGVYGGARDTERLRIEPTFILEPTADSSLLREEIFGPILPILFWSKESDLDARLAHVHGHRRQPLAFYVFSRNEKWARELAARYRFGGGAINDVLVHIVGSELPFGGVGHSGIGAYHGKFGFETFTHRKAIFIRRGLGFQFWFDLPLRYPPYSEAWRRFKGLFT